MKNKAFLVIIAILFLVIVSGGYYLWWQNNTSDTEEISSTKEIDQIEGPVDTIKAMFAPSGTTTSDISVSNEGEYTIFVQISGIEGESTEVMHKKWIEAYSFNQEVTRELSVSRVSIPPVHGDFILQKEVDSTTPKIYEYVNIGRTIPTVKIEVVGENEAGTLETLLSYTLTNATITSDKVDANSYYTKPIEELHLKYEKIIWTYTALNPETGVTETHSYGWDALENKPYTETKQ